MWIRNMGIVMVVGAGLIFYRTAPTADQAKTVLADVPMQSIGHAQVPFPVIRDGAYHVAVSYRYSPPKRQDDNETFVEPQFFCEFLDTGPTPKDAQSAVSPEEQYTPTVFIRQSAPLRPSSMSVQDDPDGRTGRTYLLAAQRLEAGHTYTGPSRGRRLLEGRRPHVQVLRANELPGYQAYIRAVAAFNCGFLITVGLLLTFWDGSPVLLRRWLRHNL